MRHFAPVSLLLVLTLLDSCHSTRRAVSNEHEQSQQHAVGFALSRQASLDSVLQVTAMQFDSLEICIDPVTDARSGDLLGDTAKANALPLTPAYRYRLRAARASLHKSSAQISSISADSLSTIDTAVSMSSQRETESEQADTAVYKPPNSLFIILLAVVIIAAFLLIKHKIRL